MRWRSQNQRVMSQARGGLAVIWLIGSAALIIAALSLVLETGWMNLCRSEAKVIAESAALAAASSVVTVASDVVSSALSGSLWDFR